MYSQYNSNGKALSEIKKAFNSWVGKTIHVGNGEYDTLKVISINNKSEIIFGCNSGKNLRLAEFTDYNGLQNTIKGILGK